ncbi:anhydro-N-acetylmuramic acid kinase [Tenuifilaceae bacterium CYCD]|nr:anhydro-N-acetylmuramic acid kinase [Tenuifilaceae bacterium CYCD]
MAFSEDQMQTSYICVGVMSGTSLDGLDICLCKFICETNHNWKYSIVKADTRPYPTQIKEQLENAPNLNGEQLTHLDYQYGHWIGKTVSAFLQNAKERPQFIASHGHTIFHNPQHGYTLQIGKGSAIAAQTTIPCISDFRSSDVCKGGQGAPLVPIGDKLLFSEYDICLNLGGIANLSYDNNQNQRIAYDISPCNMLLNCLAGMVGKEFDKDGEIGKLGDIDSDLLTKMNLLDYYSLENPKSLGREWFEGNILKLINASKCSTESKLRTSYEHIAAQITNVTNKVKGNTLLITGGGAKNSFLIDLIINKSTKKVIIPDALTIDFKEALVFAFLGVLYKEKLNGALASVTGAKTDSIGGCLYY